jgi:hypothetical protein
MPNQRKNNTILDEALIITDGARRVDYGSVEESFQKISTVASVLCNKEITPKDIALIFIAQKLTRESNKHTRDNLVDICGYTRLASILEGDEDENIIIKRERDHE